ncbi:AAA family ATPase [Porphyrobacter sp. AAP60]|uniref:AAA family ATPase n=1 Tax=Porphyrobacter sp. AAP60 TaxID=1523423 RepID=UPI000A7C316C|nr:AAA family ATPase [Porphyrobacter sp. AAP60]
MTITFFNFEKGELATQAMPNSVQLIYNDWDDWFTYETKFGVRYTDQSSRTFHLGWVKIGHAGQSKEERRTEIPKTFSQLPEGFFSVGLSGDYYSDIVNLGIAEIYFPAMHDMAYDLTIYENYKDEDVAKISLFRSMDTSRLKTRYNRLAHGDVELTPYNFKYTFPPRDERQVGRTCVLDFSVKPGSLPPTNVHVLIGRNGVGKTTTLNNMIEAIMAPASNSGQFEIDSISGGEEFANLAAVTFSAFDSFDHKIDDADFHHIGLRGWKDDDGEKIPYLKHTSELVLDFVSAASSCLSGVKRERWARALATLSSDPLFAESGVSDLADTSLHFDDWDAEAKDIFGGLSSGHAIVLLTITRLVQVVEEQTFVLLDEPEGHLHPPLLSAFIRALSELLISQNGVALVATHSPVVLQEVPSNCVWIINRSGRTIAASRPPLETFGEDVGRLTHAVFGLEITETGFHKIIRQKMVDEGWSLDQLLGEFEDQIGAEGMAVARSLQALK